jgi:hypothetical protein
VSQIKRDKTEQENAAVKNDASKKLRKAGGEQQAAQDVVTEKIGPDHVVHKHIAGVKYEKQKNESDAGKKEATVKLTNADAASKDAAKMTKVTTENTATQNSQIKKNKTVAGESNAVKSDVGTKNRKAGKEQQDAITIKQKSTAGSNGPKNAEWIKGGKSAAESNAAQQDANTKLQKQTEKASPK